MSNKEQPKAPTPPATPTPSADAAKPADAAPVSKDTVTVTVPKAFSLRTDDGHVHPYKPGIQEMPPAHVGHWYSKANGVQEYKPETSPAAKK